MTQVYYLPAFDSERPYGKSGETLNGMKQRLENLGVVAALNEYCGTNKIPRTFFVLGSMLEQAERQGIDSKALRQIYNIEDSLVEIANHSYSHPTIARLERRPDKTPITPDKLKEEIAQTKNIVSSILNRTTEGFRTPLGYAKGLQSADPRVLEILASEGILYISSDLRDENEGLMAPLRNKDGSLRQPYRYRNNLVEIPSHGWQDSSYLDTSRTVGTVDFPRTLDTRVAHIRDLFVEAKQIAETTERDIYLSNCNHPWAIAGYDGTSIQTFKGIIEATNKLGIKCLTHKQAYEQLKGKL
ncbi:polysaccharide deacetylase family protein [Candidatus Woesearchaeota archaeon]|nr:polysaccharide deacetylase family protein [Candidatus Woesearchaeota archaeon]